MKRTIRATILAILLISSLFGVLYSTQEGPVAVHAQLPTRLELWSPDYRSSSIVDTDGSLGVDSEFDLRVNVTGASSIAAFDVRLLYDFVNLAPPGYTQVLDAMFPPAGPLAGGLFDPAALPAGCSADVPRQDVDIPQGKIRFGVVLLGEGCSVAGTGTLFTMRFRVQSVGSTTIEILVTENGQPATKVSGPAGPLEYEAFSAYFRNKPGTPPIADFTFTAGAILRGETVSFDASPSFDPGHEAEENKGIVRYRWGFGDASSPEEGPQQSHIFVTNPSLPIAGNFTVTLVVWDEDDDIPTSKTKKVEVGIHTSTDHDLAVVSVETIPVSVTVGEQVEVRIRIQNQGLFPENSNLFVSYDNATLATGRVDVGVGQTLESSFLLNTRSLTPDTYFIRAFVEPVPGETDLTDNTGQTILFVMEPHREEHDLSVRLQVPDVLPLEVSAVIVATVFNRGTSDETDVELQLLIDGEIVESMIVPSLRANGASASLSFNWTPTSETTFNVTAVASPVAGENLVFNNSVSRTVTILGGAVADPEGDTFGIGPEQPDIQLIEAHSYGTNLVFTIAFFTAISPPSANQPNSVGGFIDIDADQDPTTGTRSFQTFYGRPPPSGLGDEFVISLFYDLFNPGQVAIFDAISGLLVGTGPITFTENSLTASVPLSVIGNDEIVNYGTLIGSFFEPTDEAPNFCCAFSIPTGPRLSISLDPREGPVGTNAFLMGENATPDGTVEVFFATFDPRTGHQVRTPLEDILADGSGDFTFAFTIPPSIGGDRTIIAFDSVTGRAAQAFFTVKSQIILSPNRGPVGTTVTVRGTGFTPGSVQVSFNDMPIALTLEADDNGDFTAAFTVPTAQPGTHQVKAVGVSPFATPLQTAASEFSVVDNTDLSLVVEAGALHFPGEIVDIFVQVALHGSPVDATDLTVTLRRPDGSSLELTATRIGMGLYRASTQISSTDVGTYLVQAMASLVTDTVESRGTAIKAFEVSSLLPDAVSRIITLEGMIATIETSVGELTIDLEQVRPRITKIEEDLATIETTVGTIQADVASLRPLIVSIEGRTATIETTVGTLSGTIDEINGDVATVTTDVGQLTAQVPQLENVPTISNYALLASVLAGLSLLGAAASVAIALRRPK